VAWDVKVPDTYAESHMGSTATKPGAAAYKTALLEQNSWYIARIAIELTQEIGRRITTFHYHGHWS